MVEYQAVMTRPEHLDASGLSVDEVDVLLDAVAAVNGRADAIVTFNIRDFRGVAGRFGVEALAPGEAWKTLEAKT